MAYRLEQLEHGRPTAPAPGARPRPSRSRPSRRQAPAPAPDGPPLELEQLQEAWQRTIVSAVEQKSMPTAAVLRLAHPAELSGETLTVEFPESASFHRQLAEDPKNAVLLQDALYEVTGRRLALAFATGEGEEPVEHHERPMGEDEIYELMKETFDAREVEEP